MKLTLRRAPKEYLDAVTGNEIICVRGAKRLGWPEAPELVIEVRRDEAPGFTEVILHEFTQDDDGSYTISVDGEEFYSAYTTVLDYLDSNEGYLYYRLCEARDR